MWRLWLYESCSTFLSIQNSVRSLADVVDVPVRSLRKPGGPCFWCNVIWRWCTLLYFCVFFSGYSQVLILRRMWIVYGNWFTMIIHHAAGGSKQLKRYKRQSLKVDAWTAKEFKTTTLCWVIFFWRPVSSDSIPRFVCGTRDGTSETYLAQYTWYDDLK